MRAIRALMLLCVCPVLFSPIVQAQYIVTHPSNDTKHISASTLRAIFSMRINEWPDGTPITVFVLDKDSKQHDEFCKNVLQIFPYQLQRTWNRLVFSGSGQAPKRVKSIAEMKNSILSTPGAIGYLPEDTIDENIRILSVQ